MKICFYCLRTFDELPLAEQFSKEMGIDFVWTAEYPNEHNMELAKGCDAVSVTPSDMSAPMLEKFHALGVRNILCHSIGYDHVDLKRAKELGMRVANVNYPPSGVANYAIMLMMMCQRKIVQILDRSRVQDYTLKGKLGMDLSFSTVGVIGTGKIGTTVIKNLSGFGCRILACSRHENPEAAKHAEYVDFDTLCRESDIITLHSSANAATTHMLNAESFAEMKDGVIIVNTARGKLIDTGALIDALESGKVGGAALDVLENENGLYYYNRIGDDIPNREMAVLRSFPNVILSPHTAFYTTEAVRYMVRGNFEAEYAFENGLKTEHAVL